MLFLRAFALIPAARNALALCRHAVGFLAAQRLLRHHILKEALPVFVTLSSTFSLPPGDTEVIFICWTPLPDHRQLEPRKLSVLFTIESLCPLLTYWISKLMNELIHSLWWAALLPDIGFALDSTRVMGDDLWGQFLYFLTSQEEAVEL